MDDMESIGDALGKLRKSIPSLQDRPLIPRVATLSPAQQLEELRRNLRVQSLDNTFENLKRVKGMEMAIDTAQALANGTATYSIVLIYGTTGNGKSHVCDAVALQWYKRGLFARVLVWSELAAMLVKYQFSKEPDSPDPSLIVDRLAKAERLIIDDFGMGGSDSKLPVGWLERIVDWRYHERLPMLLTTNLDLKELPDRIVSRFSDVVRGRLVLNSAPDYRTHRRQQ